MKKVFILVSWLFLIQLELIAQDQNDRSQIIEQTNTKALNEFASKKSSQYARFSKKAIEQGIPTEILNKKNEIEYLAGFDKKGNPIYDSDDNVNAAISSRVSKIWTGGTSGLDLSGLGIQIGHWEAGGLALTTHQELAGKVTHAENEAVSSHSTHTACTMIGEGIDQDARGSAPNATIVSRRSNNDEAEIASFGALGGLLSNHSYSTGNPNGDIPLYGHYTENAAEWDEILFNAPYLTLCKSAGNTRNDGVNTGDNGYDLLYTVATCKNLLTIGAINDVLNYTGPQSITHSAFSTWGPTDDWRIKPDLTANGVSLYSADDDSDTDYTVKSGTSMSTPSVTGAIALLQEHYHNQNSVYMKAATVKALLLGTTDEAGDNDGPDFQHGWGLINAERAAGVISKHGITSRINELSLTNGSTYTADIEVDGSSPLSLTIAWTDPQGTPVSTGILDNLTPMLVNDLDVRITKSAAVYYPWKMTPNSSSNNFDFAATKGDNFRDNVERIDINSLPAGIYTVTVTHKNTLVNGFQDFSMMINGISPNQVSTENFGQGNSLLVYPNPSNKGYFNVKISNDWDVDNYEIQIIDLLGKVRMNNLYSEQQVKLNVSHLDSGIYIIRIKTEKGEYKQLLKIEN